MAAPALAAFRQSCPRLLARADHSGLTRPQDWQPACAAAANWPAEDAAAFFTSQFEAVTVGSGATYVTGYFEPRIAGARSHQPGFDVPVYGVPPDLVHARPGDAPLKSNGQTPFGRYDETGHFLPYYERADIIAGRLAGQGLEIAWAADPVEFYFLQVQGSGQLVAPDGSVMRIGYAADNGQNYTGIGAIMRNEGLIGTAPGQYPGSMQGIMQYLRDHPEAGAALMNQNKSWVFFREITGDGPLGALGVPVRAHVSLAADPLFVPLGAPVFLLLDRPTANGLWVAQDTGGAIKGANRFDSFWGSGADARLTAGGLASRGSAWVLLPKGALARLNRR
jgi:membrane-bound lytic murein transglycosylase A